MAATATTTTTVGPAVRLRQKYERLLRPQTALTDANATATLNVMRRLILLEGLPPMTAQEREDRQGTLCSLRGRVWKAMLAVNTVSADAYIALVERGPSAVHEKISNDGFRTFATDVHFKERVTEDQLVRVLNAYAQRPGQGSSSNIEYLQGMNVLLAPIMFVMPELDAFYTFSRLLRDLCPMYVQGNFDGVHYGLDLVDECLRFVDPVLFQHLASKQLTAKVYAFPSVLTLCACTPPLEEVLKLWDFFFAYGVHLAVLCFIGQCLMIRDDLLRSSNPMRLLQKLPPLQATRVISFCVRLVRLIPRDLYERLARHPWDRRLYSSNPPRRS